MKKMIKKKHLVICLVTIMLLGLVSAASVAEEKKWEERPVEITVSPMYDWHLDRTVLQMMTEDLPSLWDKEFYMLSTQLFNVTHPDIRINFRASEDEWGGGVWLGIRNKEKVMTALAAGEAPAIYQLDVLGDPASLISEGYAADITDFVNQWDLKDYLMENRAGLWASYWKDGRCYGIPHGCYTSAVVAFRKDWFKEAGIFNDQGDPGPSLDWTISDFLAISRKVSDPKKERWAIEISGEEGYVKQIFDAFGIPLTIPDPTAEYTWRSALNIPEAQAVYEFYKELAWNQKSVLTSTGAEPLGPGMDFVGGKTAMKFWWSDSVLWRANWSTNYHAGPSFEHIAGTPEDMGLWESAGMVPFPKGPGGVRVSSAKSNVWAINPTLTKEQQEAAWEWLTWEIPNYGPRGRLQELARRIRAGHEVVTVAQPMTYPLPEDVLLPKDFIPKWARPRDLLDQDPAAPAAPAYGLMILGMKDQLTPLIETIISDPNADLQKIADAAADRINKGVLDYKVEGQTVEDFKEYYTALDAFYKENFPEYYEKTFKELYEKYYKVW